MNIERINLLADTIEQHRIPDLGFNMSSFANWAQSANDDRSGHSCGTTACIGGHAVALATRESLESLIAADGITKGRHLHDEARDWLEISDDQAHQLFYSSPCGVSFSDVTPQQAVNTLRHLALTGYVDWEKANEVEEE